MQISSGATLVQRPCSTGKRYQGAQARQVLVKPNPFSTSAMETAKRDESASATSLLQGFAGGRAAEWVAGVGGGSPKTAQADSKL
ncbi:hypothetical protein SCARD494_10012 [Seiridium cardinale]